MRWVVGLLLVANVAAYMWHVAHRDVPAADRVAAVVDGEGMRLLREQAAGDGEPAPEAADVDPGTASAAGSPRTCLRIGPFIAPLGMQAGAERLAALDLSPSERTVARRTVRAHRVFLGPFEESGGLARARRRLNEAGITDHYVIRDEQGGGVVSLGLFSSEASAGDYAARLAEAGIEADTRVETRELGPTHWLELLDADSLRRKVEDVRAIEWSEQQVAVRDIECPAATAGPAP